MPCTSLRLGSLGRLDRFGIGPKLETSISSLMTTEVGGLSSRSASAVASSLGLAFGPTNGASLGVCFYKL